jgi:integrase
MAKDRRSNLTVSARVRSMTLANYLTKHWFPLVEISVEPCTARNYRLQIDKYLVPGLGQVRVGSLDRGTIQGFYASLIRGNNGLAHKPLSKTTVIRIHSLLHNALEDLVQAGQLPSNPARGARPRHTKSDRYEYTIWTQRQVEQFLRRVALDDLFALWRLFAFTGMRRGEALALKRSDLRLRTRQLSVRRALGEADGMIYVTRPKADQERVIELDQETVGALRKHLRKRPSSSSLDEWVFSDEYGDVLRPGSVTRRFGKLVAASKLPRIRLHDLRHTHASHLILAGANIKAVQERLGHSDVVVTLNIYSHVLPTTQRDAVRQLEKFYSTGSG